MADDPLNRAFEATTPDDPADPPRFSQGSELTKDVLVLELRKFMAAQLQTSARLAELPTIEKYNTFGAGAGDPYETVVAIVRKFPGILEALPHIVVTTADGVQRPLTIGPPLIAAVQESPRIIATLPGPYDLSYPGSSPAQDGQSLVVQTRPGGLRGPYRVSTLQFVASRFIDFTAATAQEVVDAINEQALYVRAFVVPVGLGSGVELRTGGPYGRGTPNEIEVLSTSSAGVLVALGLSHAGTGDTIGGTAPNMTLTDAGGTFTAADVGRYLVLAGAPSTYFNDGRFLITAVAGPTSLTYENKYGRAEAAPAATWFIGDRDDSTNILRPPANRFVYSWDLDCQVAVLTEDDNTRTELVDLVGSFFTFWLESKYFTFLGRGAMGMTGFETESYQINLKSTVRSQGENEVPRPDDGKDKLYNNSFSFQTHTTMYLDRAVRVLSGPSVGQGWTVEGADFTPDETLPTPS